MGGERMSHTKSISFMTGARGRSLQLDLGMIVALGAAISALEQIWRLL
jgi:hypothetical protein